MNQKTLILLCIVSIIILVILVFSVYKIYYNKYKFEKDVLLLSEKNEKTVFSIDKITFFSSCNAVNSSNSTSEIQIDNLYQYTDIAIFLNNNSEEFNSENTLKKVWIENIKFGTKPELGTPNLFYQNINNFAKNELLQENALTDYLEFTISSNEEEDLSYPTLYNNCANPITLRYQNQNIKNNYTISDASSITYDGSLLKDCDILLNSISCSLSFDIYIVNNLNQEFKSSVYLDIPLSDETNSIYDGQYMITQNTDYPFLRYQ